MQPAPQALEQINKTLTTLSDQLGMLSKQITKIESHLYNDTQTGNLGAVHRIGELDKRVEVLEEDSRKQRWFFTKLAIGLPILISAIWRAAEYFFSKK